MDVRRGKMKVENRHYEALAKWVKEVALLVLAALVVQNIVAGSGLTSPQVLVGAVISFLAYISAFYFLLKS